VEKRGCGGQKSGKRVGAGEKNKVTRLIKEEGENGKIHKAIFIMRESDT
jgi:hypothetical protein